MDSEPSLPAITGKDIVISALLDMVADSNPVASESTWTDINGNIHHDIQYQSMYNSQPQAPSNPQLLNAVMAQNQLLMMQNQLLMQQASNWQNALVNLAQSNPPQRALPQERQVCESGHPTLQIGYPSQECITPLPPINRGMAQDVEYVVHDADTPVAPVINDSRTMVSNDEDLNDSSWMDNDF